MIGVRSLTISVANLRSTLPSLLQGCLGRCRHSHHTIMTYDTLNYTHVIITTFPWLVKFNQFSSVIRWDAVLCWRWPPSWWSPRRSPWRPWPRSSAGWQTWVPWATRRCAERGEFVIREPTNSDKGDQGEIKGSSRTKSSIFSETPMFLRCISRYFNAHGSLSCIVHCSFISFDFLTQERPHGHLFARADSQQRDRDERVQWSTCGYVDPEQKTKWMGANRLAAWESYWAMLGICWHSEWNLRFVRRTNSMYILYIDIDSGVNFILWASQAPDTMRMFQCIGKIAENMGEDLSGDPQQEGMVFRSFVESHFIQSLFLGQKSQIDRTRGFYELFFQYIKFTCVGMTCGSLPQPHSVRWLPAWAARFDLESRRCLGVQHADPWISQVQTWKFTD